MYLDKQFAAFLFGLFIGLMTARQMYVRVVSNETGRGAHETGNPTAPASDEKTISFARASSL